MRIQLFRDAVEYLRVSDLHDPDLGKRYVIASVAATLRDLAGVQVPGAAWPVSLMRVPGTQGVYAASDGIGLAIGSSYMVTVTADDGETTSTWVQQVSPLAPEVATSVVPLEVDAWDDVPPMGTGHVLSIALGEVAAWSDVPAIPGGHVLTQV